MESGWGGGGVAVVEIVVGAGCYGGGGGLTNYLRIYLLLWGPW